MMNGRNKKSQFIQRWNLFQKQKYIQILVLILSIIGLYLIAFYISYYEAQYNLIISGILPVNKLWILYTGLGLVLLAILILFFSPLTHFQDSELHFRNSLLGLNSKINKLVGEASYDDALQLIKSILEQDRLLSYEQKNQYIKYRDIIQTNQFLHSRIELGNKLLKDRNFPLFKWEIEKMAVFIQQENGDLTERILTDFGNLHQAGTSFFYSI